VIDEPIESLSPQGLARREEILTELKLALLRRSRVRRAARRSAVLVCVALPVLAAAWLSTARVAEERLPRSDPGNAQLPLELEIVHNDPTIVERCLATDDELLAFFAEARRPAGLVRIDGRVQVLEAGGAD